MSHELLHPIVITRRRALSILGGAAVLWSSGEEILDLTQRIRGAQYQDSATSLQPKLMMIPLTQEEHWRSVRNFSLSAVGLGIVGLARWLR